MRVGIIVVDRICEGLKAREACNSGQKAAMFVAHQAKFSALP